MRAVALNLIFLAVAVMSGCATVTVNYDFDPAFNFTDVKKYDWLPIPEKVQMNELTVKNIEYAVNRELAAKGFTMTSQSPDVLIAFHATKEKRVDTQAWGYTYGSGSYYHGVWKGTKTPWGGPSWGGPGPYYETYRSGMDTYEYEVGTLVLDFVNAKTKELVWRGTAVGIVDPRAPSKDLNEAVTKLLENFPPVQKK